MMWRIDTKSVALGLVLGAGLCVLVGAARNELTGPVGRYQACSSQNTAYLVDTITGQVWLSSEREFRTPKLRAGTAVETPSARSPILPSPTVQAPIAQDPAPSRPPAARTPVFEIPRTPPRPTGFVGKWVLKHPTEGEFGIQILAGGRAVLTLGDQKSEGKWEMTDNQITITTDKESMTARLDDQGRLLVNQGDSEPIAFEWTE
jgi:hypothetical protein